MIYWLLKYYGKLRSSMFYKVNLYSPVRGKETRKTTFYWLKAGLFLQDAWLTYHQQWHSCRLGIKFCQYMHQPFLAAIWAEIQRNSALLLTSYVSCSLPELFMALLSESPHSHPALSNVKNRRAILELNNIEPLVLDLIVQHAEHLSPDAEKGF